jgi:hypothetical protein
MSVISGMRFFLLFKVQREVVEAADGNVTARTVGGKDGKSCRIGKTALRSYFFAYGFEILPNRLRAA